MGRNTVFAEAERVSIIAHYDNRVSVSLNKIALKVNCQKIKLICRILLLMVVVTKKGGFSLMRTYKTDFSL